MALSTSADGQVIEVGKKFNADYKLASYGWLAREASALPASLVGNGDISRMASLANGLADHVEGVPAASGNDPVWQQISPLRDKGMAVWSMSREILDDGDVLDGTLQGIARNIANFKDEKIIANMLANLSPSSVANQAALSLSGILGLAGDLPSSDKLHHVYLSSKSFYQLKAEEHSLGFDSGEGMVGGLPAVLVNGGNSDVSGSFVAAVGSAMNALGYAQDEDRVLATDQASGVADAIVDSVSLIARCRFAHAILDARWMRVLEVA